MGRLVVGHGLEDRTEVGPLIDGPAVSFVQDLVGEAAELGAEILCGGRAPERSGHFYPPTVLANTPPTARIAMEEIFGPVAAVQSFAAEHEALELANRTEYGLVAYIYTRDTARAFRLAGQLEVGMIGINRGVVSNAAAPFGGVKASGYGREGRQEGIFEYLDRSTCRSSCNGLARQVPGPS